MTTGRVFALRHHCHEAVPGFEDALSFSAAAAAAAAAVVSVSVPKRVPSMVKVPKPNASSRMADQAGCVAFHGVANHSRFPPSPIVIYLHHPPIILEPQLIKEAKYMATQSDKRRDKKKAKHVSYGMPRFSSFCARYTGKVRSYL